MKNQRRIAVDLLNKYEKENTSIETLMGQIENLSGQEYGFIKTLLYGVIRYKLSLDNIIKKLSKISFDKLDIEVINILRISLYQIIFMDHIPQRAVVNEAVNLCKFSKNSKAQGFINGSLRNFLRKTDKFLQINEKDPLTEKSIKYSMPRWIIKEIKEAYKDQDLEKILMAFNKEIPFAIRITKDLGPSKESLQNQAFELKETKLHPKAFLVKNPQGIFSTIDYYQGNFYVQSLSSQDLGYQLEKFGPYSHVLDLCAAPGGKISHIMNLQANKGNFLACDISEDKLKLIEENKKRLGLANLQIKKNDATKYNEDFLEKFDLIIADAPCSALGLMRKLPEVKYNKSKETITNLRQIQKNILDNAKVYVKKSGLIAYSTCTFTLEENEHLIDEFLQENKNFKLIYRKKTSPLEFDSDGFSINILKRID